MAKTWRGSMAGAVLVAAVVSVTGAAQGPGEPLVRVDLAYAAPGDGVGPDFSPYGTQVPLTPLPAASPLPTGAVRPASVGTLKIGPNEDSWIRVLATVAPGSPQDLSQLFVDRNRNGRFDDDGPPRTATPSQNEKTKDWWSSIDSVEISVPYGNGGAERFLVSFWSVRRDGGGVPDVIRYSRRSWRSGSATIAGVPALVAAMDANNDAIFTRSDYWSVVNADVANARRVVLSRAEARPGSRFMFLKRPGGGEAVLEFRRFSPDGRFVELAVVDRPITKADDRAPDDMIAEERPRPRTPVPFVWSHDFTAALAQAKTAGRSLLIDFETTWCGPCKTMDEWIWNDADVAARLNAAFVGVKVDGDVEKAIVARYKVTGYPTIVVVDGDGREVTRVVGYQSSKAMIGFLR
jgi:thiol-disulfide isomerase/thioredoxin